MAYKEKRLPYEFDYETKCEALRRCPVCEGCGCPGTKDNPLQIDHIIPIFFALKYPVFALEAIKSTANARVLCKRCHEKRNHYDTTEILALAPVVITRFVEELRREENERKKNQS